MSLLRILIRLSVGIEIDLIDTGLLPGTRFGVPCIGTQLDLAEFLDSEATPYPLAFWRQRLGATTTSSKLIAQHVQPAGLPAPNMRAKQPGLSIIDCRHRMPASSREAEEFINLAHRVRFGWLWSHTYQDMPDRASLYACMPQIPFYDPVVLD